MSKKFNCPKYGHTPLVEAGDNLTTIGDTLYSGHICKRCGGVYYEKVEGATESRIIAPTIVRPS